MIEPAFAPLGHFCWPELASPDPEASKAFYGELFGWEARELATARGAYTVFQLEGLDVAAAYRAEGPQCPPHWGAYLAVADADATAARIRELGGEVLMGPFEAEQAGRMALVKDPSGAEFALWQARDHRGAGIFKRPGALAWAELSTRDPAACEAFYTALCGWRAEARTDFGLPYTQWRLRGETVGGMLDIRGEDWEGIPPHWGLYFAAADCEASAEAAREAGAILLLPPTELPGVCSFALLRDPQGAVFSLIQMEA